jgi:hypothetical protein
MELALAIIGAIAAVAAAVAAFGAWNAAAKANETSRNMAAIERDRRHSELTPKFGITCLTKATVSDLADLHLVLEEGGTDYLDEVVITILDEKDIDRWARGLPTGVSQEEAEAFVWGGWEFNTGASAQVVSNRATRGRSYSLLTGKNWEHLSLTRTRPGLWMTAMTPDQWQKQYEELPIRLRISCRRDGYEPWVLLREVHPEYIA